MAKGFYIGVDSKARKAKKIYIGVDGKARKVKKMYIGVDGKARLLFSGRGDLKQYTGTLPKVPTYEYYSMVSNANYAYVAKDESSAVQINSSLTVTTASQFPYYSHSPRGTRFNDLAVYVATDSYEKKTKFTAYDSNGTATKYNISCIYDLPYEGAVGALSNAIFIAGGDSTIGDKTLIHTYDKSFTCTTGSVFAFMKNSRSSARTASLDSVALIGCGGTADVESINTSFTVSVLSSPLSVTRSSASAVRAGNNILFAGGQTSYSSAGYSRVVDAYNSSLTKVSVSSLRMALTDPCVTSLDEYGLVFICEGGWYEVDAYDSSLTRSVIPVTESERKGQYGAASVGNYAIFAGNYYAYPHTDTLDVVAIE